MKISTDSNVVVEREGLKDDGVFTMKFNSKMSKILSDGLYSDKIKSIIRELACNSVDSHIAANKTNVPIEIHLPTYLEPTFYVKDFGIGLDHSEVLGTYTCYGASTKTESNDFTGALGLGSKSPFSYVDAFDVTAVKNGVKRQYSMYKNEEGMPSCALLLEEKTLESNGVTVKLPVKREDFSNFSSKAAEVIKWFDVRPVIKGQDIRIPVAEKPVFEGAGWKIYPKGNDYSWRSMSNPIALMGRVAYPLDPESLDISQTLKNLLNFNIVISFDIGELEVSASRESLGYDLRTKKNIKDKLEKIHAEFSKQFEKIISSEKTEWDARKKWGELFSYNSGLSYDLSTLFGNAGLKWKNTVITSSRLTVEPEKIWDKHVTDLPLSSLQSDRKTSIRMGRYKFNIECNNEIRIIFNDLETGTLPRIRYWRDNNQLGYGLIYIIGPSPLYSFDEMKEKFFGNGPTKLASELPEVPKKPRVARPTGLHLVSEYKGGEAKSPGSWLSINIDLKNGGFYVLADRYRVHDKNHKNRDLKQIVALAHNLKLIDVKDSIYIPRGSTKGKLEDLSNWKDLFETLTNKVNAVLTPTAIQELEDSRELTNLSGTVLNNLVVSTPWKLNDQKSLILVFKRKYDALVALNRNRKINDHYIQLANELDIEVKTTKVNKNTITDFYKEVMKKYPMLGMYLEKRQNGYYNPSTITGDEKKCIEDYINMIDSI